MVLVGDVTKRIAILVDDMAGMNIIQNFQFFSIIFRLDTCGTFEYASQK